MLIVRDSSDDQLLGVSPFCTHRYCALEWDQQERVFVCPCHDSRFDPQGKVVKGPAETDLTAYQVRVQDN